MVEGRRLAAARARRIILFGSLAAGDGSVGPNSDVDLVVIMPGVENIRFHKRLDDVQEVWRFPYPLDIAVYSPDEWEEVREGGRARRGSGPGVILY